MNNKKYDSHDLLNMFLLGMVVGTAICYVVVTLVLAGLL